MSGALAQSSTRIENTRFEAELVRDISEFYDDPYGFVMYAFPWGQKGTALEDETGPDTWQKEQLESIRERIQADPSGYVIRDATASGHGIGKSTETSWLILWAMSTRPHLSGVVTANTNNQLSTKTWRELALWHKRAINSHWFVWSATSFKHREHPETWAVHAIPNTEHKSEAFAGLHADHVLLLFDEASAIPDKIFEVAEGAMTTPRAMWFVFGNMTRNTGAFRECFDSQKHRWRTRQIDSRTCKKTNKVELEEWVKSYGEDSDFVRVRVRGLPPRAGDMQFIGSDTVDMAMMRELELEVYYGMPVVIGVDVARYGEDKTVIAVRAGRKLLELRKFRELDTMQVSGEVIKAILDYKPRLAATFVDGVGLGAGVVDRLRMLNHDVIEVNAGTKPTDDQSYFNKRVEMWDRMRRWLGGADIPRDSDLRSSLIGIQYGFSAARGTGEVMMLEKKRDMKLRGLSSPDEGDALAMTFAEELGSQVLSGFEPADEESFEP